MTPEGTRANVHRWKSGFLRIAKQANVPIVLVGLDYPSKTITFGKVVYAGDDINQQLDEIVAYYANYRGKYS